nr:serine/threonine-protein kinase [uncultured Lichenicoccus sp.]
MEPVESWPRHALPKGTVVQGFTIEGILGRGGFGITYRARDRLDQVFALKECFPRQFAVRHGLEVFAADTADEPGLADCLERFLREAKALSSLARLGAATDAVVRVATFCEAYRTAYIVMELLSGQTMEELLKLRPDAIDEARLHDIMLRLLLALQAVHERGMLHRDIKPSNIFLRDDGRPVLIDFGATRAVDQEHTVAYTQIVTELYSPIEQFGGNRPGPYSDLYALGMCCYRAIGGKPVDALTRQHASSRGAPDPKPSAFFVGAGRFEPLTLQTIDALLALQPEDRPQTAADALALLTQSDGTVSAIARNAQHRIARTSSTVAPPLDGPRIKLSESTPAFGSARRGPPMLVLCGLAVIVGFCATFGGLLVWSAFNGA